MDCARNIITANFSGGGTSATTAPLWQWDYGQALCITGIEDLPAAFEVHFSTNRTGGVSTTAVGADGQVTIPNVLLTVGKNLNAWIYLSDAQGEGETEYSITIPVKARPMPETYDAEATGEFDDVVRQVSEYAETAQTAADNAGASATAAAGSASAAAASASGAAASAAVAEQARVDAVTAKGQAETAAQTATEKALQTAQNASQAALDAGRAESAAGRAESAESGAGAAKTAAEAAAQSAAASAATADEKATLAGQSATAAAGSASAAAQSAASIEGDVQIASQKASEAQTAAGQAVTAKDAAVTAQQGAETAATNAGQSASTATTKAAEAATSASNAAQSKTDAEAAATRAETAAATLTVDDELSSTSTNPVQNKVIDAELTDVKSALDEKANNTNKLTLVWTENKSIKRDGNVATISGVYATLDFIQVYNGQILKILAYAPGTSDNIVFYGTDKSTVIEYVNNSTTSPIFYTVQADGYMRLSNSPSQIPNSDAYVLVANPEYPSVEDLSNRIDEADKSFEILMSGAEYKYPLKWTSGGYINASGGVSSNANYIYTNDYYPVVPGIKLEANLYASPLQNSSDVTIMFYDGAMLPMTASAVHSSGETITVPEGAAYFRCSNKISEIAEADAYVIGNPDPGFAMTYFDPDRAIDVTGETVKKANVSSPFAKITYKGSLNRQKRFLAIGFDDLRASDINMIMPLFEKYRARATFNKTYMADKASPTEKVRTRRIFYGDHELGDHTFLHYSCPYFDPNWNGQNPDSPDGSQTPFPTNNDFRTDAGNGKNVFGKTLTSNVNMGGVSGVTWANLTDAQCQTIREYYTVFKNPTMSVLLDNLSNKYLGTSGTSAGSWDSVTGKYTGGIFTGCSTSQNHEVWERICQLIAAYNKNELGINWNMYTWSRPGANVSSLRVSYDGKSYYDTNHEYLESPQTRFHSSLTGEDRSWTDVLLNCGYKVSHDYPTTGNMNYYFISRQMIFNASLSRRDAIAQMTNRVVSFSALVNAYPETYFSGTKSKAAQMYDTDGQFRSCIERLRRDTANGMIAGEMIDSTDNYSFRVFFENLLKYCEVAGIEVITKAEAYNIAFENIINDGNLIGNETLRNTAAEFITDSTNMPTNPDGYDGSCSVTTDSNGIPVLVTSGNVNFIVFGVPYGKLKYTADVKGSGTIKFYGLKNNVQVSAGTTSLMHLGTITVDSASDFTGQEKEIIVPKAELESYEPYYEGYGNRICGVKIVYSTGLNVKNIRLVQD